MIMNYDDMVMIYLHDSRSAKVGCKTSATYLTARILTPTPQTFRILNSSDLAENQIMKAHSHHHEYKQVQNKIQ
ncbi:hypothetical protein QQP08_026526 [Theobroma cacao]|nr:hypothetical protein QQP08_026526 [Theobroma cacao]